MKKNKTFTSGLFIAIIAIVTLSLCPSCGNKKGNNLSIPGIDFASAEVGSPEWLMELTPVPLSHLTQHNEHRGGIDPSKPIPKELFAIDDAHYELGGFIDCRGLAFKNKAGEYIMFDNDENYESWCIPIMLYHDVLWKYFTDEIKYNEIQKLGIPTTYSDWDPEWWVSHPEKVEEYDKVRMQYFKEAFDATMLYLMGEKDKITNKDLYKIIDKEYYDDHIEDRYFSLESSKYGFKKYLSPYTYHTALGGIYDNGDEHVYFQDNDLNYISLAQGKVPTDALVCY